jgi:hypothetical protein
MRTTYYERIQRFLADDEWHSEEDLAEVVRFPRLWVRELAAEGSIEVRCEDDRIRVRRREQLAAA